MSNSCDDILSVKRLLEEKEKDLELTAQIGKGLLQQNQTLNQRISELDNEVKYVNEQLAQLSHELQKKNDLIIVLTNDLDEETQNGSTNFTKMEQNTEMLQRKICELEEENRILRQEALQLERKTTETDEEYKKKISELTAQLHFTNNQCEELRKELDGQKEENTLQHEQITALSSKLKDSELRLNNLAFDNEEQSSILCITKENQNLLAIELADFKTKYQEVVSLLNEAQDQIRRSRKRQQTGKISSITGVYNIPNSNFDNEETNCFDSIDSGIYLEKSNSSYKDVFKTVRSVSRTNSYENSGCTLGAMAVCSAVPTMMSTKISQIPSSSFYSCNSTSSIYSNNSNFKTSVKESRSYKDNQISDYDNSSTPKTSYGIPGVPGAKDLEAAIKRLTPTEILARRAMLSNGSVGTYNYEENQNAQLGCRTPDSIMSTGRSSASGFSQHYRLPEKLQIIKPLEGSQTLSHWSKLATPTLEGLLEERPGVKIRGGRELDELGLHVYSLSDVEEDVEDNPGKRFQSNCIYTFTNSTVMHPDDGSMTFSVPQSQIVSQVTSRCSSRQSSAPPTPRHSRRNSCSTFSVSLSLASMLNERGIKAVTPSALNTPCGANYSPTVTPCNSPEGSPTHPSPLESQFLTGLLTSGAELLRRKLTGETDKQQYVRNKITLSKLERRALKSIKILEKVENIGLENIFSANTQQNLVSPLTFQGSSHFYSTYSRSASPMARLTSLKNLSTNEVNHKTEEVKIDRDAIKAIIDKSLSTENLKSPVSGSISSHPTSSGNISINFDSKNSHILNEMTTETEPNNIRVKHLMRQKSRRNVVTGRQRPDLGKIGNSTNIRSDLGTVSNSSNSILDEEKSTPMGFVGTISSLLFGRKGGLL